MLIVNKNIYKYIRTLLIEKELTQTDIADKIGITKQTVSTVCRGLCESQKVRQAIEEILGEKIWNTSSTEEPKPPTKTPNRKQETRDLRQIEINCEAK